MTQQLAIYVLRRLAVAVVQLFGITVAVFMIIRWLPADPVAQLVGFNATEEIYRRAEVSLHLDKSVLTQFGIYLGLFPGQYGRGLLQGELGTSWITGSSVYEAIRTFFPVTLELIVLSFLVACLVAVPVGVLAAMRPGRLADRMTFGYGLFAGAQPEFWWGLAFSYIFFYKLGIAPAPLGRSGALTVSGAITGFATVDALLQGRWSLFVEVLHHLMLPVLTLAFVVSGPVIKMVRVNVTQVLQSDFVVLARSMGLPERRVAMYTLRNAFAPSLTLIGILFGFMIGGAVLIEQVFSLGGLGQYAVRSILSFDFPAIQGVVLIITAFSLLVYLVMDLIHVAVDPRAIQR